MVFKTEDGTGLPDSNSFASLPEAETYVVDRGLPDASWVDLDDEVKQGALVKATDFLVQKYRLRWKGIRVKFEQALDWPRAGVQTEDYFEPDTGARESLIFNGLAFMVPDNIVPPDIKKATIELAIRAAVGDLAPDLARGGQVVSETVGEISVTYSESAPANTTYQTVNGWLRPYLKGSSSRRKLSRA